MYYDMVKKLRIFPKLKTLGRGAPKAPKKPKPSKTGKNGKSSESEKKPIKWYFEAFFGLMSVIFRSIKYVFGKKPVMLSFTLVIAILASLIPLFQTRVQANIFDDIVNIVSNTHEISESLLYSVGILVLAVILDGLAGNAGNYLRWNIKRELQIETRLDFLKKFSSLDMALFDDPEKQNLFNKVQDRSQGMFIGFYQNIVELFRLSFGIALNLSVLFILSPYILVIAVAVIIPDAILSLVYSRKYRSLFEKFSELRRDNNDTSRYLGNEASLKELRIFRVTNFLLDRVRRQRLLAFNSHKKEFKKESRWYILTAILEGVGHGGILVLLVTFALAGSITVGLLMFYYSAVRRIQDYLASFFWRLSTLYDDSMYAKDFFDFLALESTVVSGKTRLKKSGPPLIEFKSVDFKYPGTNKSVLKDFDLKIEPGEHVAIVGENGAGKTTVIKLLMRLYDTTGGSVDINGHGLKELDLDSWYSAVGTLFQDYNFYHFDVKTNIGIGDVSRIGNVKEIEKAAKLAEAHEFIKGYDKGYDQMMSKAYAGGTNPSIGQKQRIALARAFFENAPVLILDEPTSAIDPKAEYEIFERLFDFAKGKTVVIISHRFSTVRNATRIIVMDGGKIIEEGSHEELMKIEGGKYKTAFELQKKGYE
jgi:ATP-binding cassette, subfamily B, bacterial